MATMATKLESISILSKLKAGQVTDIKLNYIALFAAISSAESNLGVDSIAPARCSFKRVIGHPVRGRQPS